MDERNRSVNFNGQQRVEKCEKAWEFLLKTSKNSLWRNECMSLGRWRERGRLPLPDTSRMVIPRGIIWRKSSTISQLRGMRTPKLFFDRTEGKLNVLSALVIHTSDREVVRMLTRPLPPDVDDVEQRTHLLRAPVPRDRR